MVVPNNKITNKTYYISLAFIGFILIFPLIDTRFIPGHDAVFQVSRIEDIAAVLQSGIFPARMLVDSVRFWGSPIGFFYPSLFNHFPALLKLAGLPIEICYNFFIALIFYSGLFTSWHGFSMLTKSKALGFLSTCLYFSSGYYLLDAYTRNALGELLALSFMPLAIACFFDIVNKPKITVKTFILLIFSISAIIESHVLSAAFVALFGLLLIIFNYKKISSDKFKRIGSVALIVLALNASFIIPFLYFFKNVPLSIDYVDNFTYSGWSAVTIIYFLVLKNFWLFTALYILFSVIIRSSSRFNLKKARIIYYLRLFSIGLLFMFASSSLFPWNQFPLLCNAFKIMQFSWRFMGIATLFLCICGGIGLHLILNFFKLKQFKYYQLLSILVCFTGLISTFWYNVSPIGRMQEKTYWTRFPYYSDLDYLYRDTNVVTLVEQGNRYITDATIANYKKELTTITFDYSTLHDTDITLPLMNYPGYIVKGQDGQELSIKENHNHMIVIPLSAGNGHVKVHYEGLQLFKITDYISLFSFLILIYFIIRIYKRNDWHKLI